MSSIRRPHRPLAPVAALLAAAWLSTAVAQTVPAAPGPDGRAPATAPSPAATSTSPGTPVGRVPAARAADGPAPEVRSTSPGTSAVPPALPANTLGVPPRVAAPDAPDTLRDPVDPTTAIAPGEAADRIRRPSAGVGNGTPTTTTTVPAPAAVPLAPTRAAPAAPATPAGR